MTIDDITTQKSAGYPAENLTDKPTEKPAKKLAKKNKARRRVAKGLAWLALIGTVALVLAEPWVLLPAAVLLVAIALWD